MMDNSFDRKIIIDDEIVYEKQNIISVVYLVKDKKHPKYVYQLYVSLWKPLDRTEIPEFILQYVDKPKSSYSGSFINPVIPDHNNNDWDFIPF